MVLYILNKFTLYNLFLNVILDYYKIINIVDEYDIQ